MEYALGASLSQIASIGQDIGVQQAVFWQGPASTIQQAHVRIKLLFRDSECHNKPPWLTLIDNFLELLYRSNEYCEQFPFSFSSCPLVSLLVSFTWHITPALIDFHWLPVTFRVQFKLLLFVYKSLRNQSPPYIKDLLSLKPATNYALRSSAQSLLFVPKANCSSLGDRAFAHAASVLWNSLPLTKRTSVSLAIFKKQLNTFLLRKAFSLFIAFEYFNFN